MHVLDENRSSRRSDSSSRLVAGVALLPVPIVVPIVGAMAALSILPVAIALALGVAAIGGWVMVVLRTRAEAESHLLARCDVSDLDHAVSARMRNLMEGLCLTMGMAMPHLWRFQSDFPVALTISQADSDGSVAVSEALLDRMDRVEMEAISALLLHRLRSGDAEAVTVATAMVSLLERFGMGALGTSLVRRFVAIDPAHVADSSACAITRYPPGLVSALTKIAAAAGTVSPGGPQDALNRLPVLARAMLVADPQEGDAFGVDGLHSLEPVRLTIGERIELLKEI